MSLRIKSTIYNFILTLCISEFVANIALDGAQIRLFDLGSHNITPVNISDSCEIQGHAHTLSYG